MHREPPRQYVAASAWQVALVPLFWNSVLLERNQTEKTIIAAMAIISGIM